MLIVSERSTVADRVRALRAGADDWVTTPCDPAEVLARIEAICRRQRQTSLGADFFLKAGELDIHNREALVRGQAIDLSPREFGLLHLLAEAEGRVIEREAIYQGVWGYAMPRGDRSVDVYVRKVRNKLRLHSPAWRYIHTHFGAGYRFDATSDHGGETGPGDGQPVTESADSSPQTPYPALLR
jgi:DNA-binding response OmpR family regulator